MWMETRYRKPRTLKVLDVIGHTVFVKSFPHVALEMEWKGKLMKNHTPVS